MNSYIDAQIKHMILLTQTFEQACQLAASEDDGTIDKSEAKILKQICAATKHFVKELEKIS